MANAAYVSGQVAVTASATLLLTVPSASGSSGVLLTNGGAAPVFLGGPGVTTSTGFSIAAGATVTIPTNGAEAHDLWVVAAATGNTVSYLYPVA